MNKNKQLIINLITTIFVLLINTLINFGLSSYIVEKIGEEAYGFISLATNFVSFATIFTTALNSMCSRFITIDIHKKNMKSANEYFTSVLFANALIILFLIVPSLIMILYLEKFIKISPNLIVDVKLLFTFIFLNFFGEFRIDISETRLAVAIVNAFLPINLIGIFIMFTLPSTSSSGK